MLASAKKWANLEVVGWHDPGEVLEAGLVGELQRGGGVADLGDLDSSNNIMATVALSSTHQSKYRDTHSINTVQ